MRVADRSRTCSELKTQLVRTAPEHWAEEAIGKTPTARKAVLQHCLDSEGHGGTTGEVKAIQSPEMKNSSNTQKVSPAKSLCAPSTVECTG